MLNWRANKLPEETGATATNPKKTGYTIAEFKALCQKDELVLVDFNATWCAPCKKVDVVLKQLEQVYGEKLKIVKIDIDEHQALATELKITSIPYLQLFRNGKQTWEHLGVASEETIRQEIGKK